MPSMSRLAAGLLVLALAGNAAAAVNKVTHRSGACTRDAAQWCPAKSAEGGFAVNLPLPFNGFTLTDDSGADVRRTDIIGSGLADGVRFMAQRLAYKGGAPMAKAWFDKLVAGEVTFGTFVSGGRGQVAGHPAANIVYADKDTRNHVRAVLAGSDIVLLIATMTPAQEAEHPGAIEKFLDSLSLQRP